MNSKEVRISLPVLSQLDQFAAQQIVMRMGGTREYRFSDLWQDTNPGKRPDATRIRMDLESFRKGRSVYQLWIELTSMFTYTPVFPEQIIDRLLTSTPVTLFIPWGVRDNNQLGTRELAAMDRIDSIKRSLEEKNIPNRILVMPADLYAKVVNQKIPTDIVHDYFESVSQEAKNRGYLVWSWSEIRNQNILRYNQLAQEFSNKRISEILSPAVVYKAYKAAQKNSGYLKEQDILNSSFSYLRERICEAIIVEETLRPIKVSMAPKNKDNDVDISLPRLYIVPEKLVLPWKGDL